MDWNVFPEIIAALVVGVMLVNYRSSKTPISVRNNMFSFILIYAFFSLLLNLFSVFTIINPTLFPLWIHLTINTAFFLFYPLITPLFIYYLLLFAFEHSPKEHRMRLKIATRALVLVTLLYFVIVILNLFTGWIFFIDQKMMYQRGRANSLSLYIAVLYSLVGIITIFRERAYVEKFFLDVMRWFPVAPLAIIIIQIYHPEIVLTGSAFAIAILSVYLNFQTQKTTIDNLTKRLNREAFVAKVEQLHRHRHRSSILLIDIDNFKHINDTYGQLAGDRLLIAVADYMQKVDEKGELYRYGGDELALISNAAVPKI
ncbi:MAG: diguanylate cyclase domain-containing protein [Sphaerochaetaceae bacterium]